MIYQGYHDIFLSVIKIQYKNIIDFVAQWL